MLGQLFSLHTNLISKNIGFLPDIKFLICSILFFTFMAHNLCHADSKAQHQNPIQNNYPSIVTAKSSTMETSDRVYGKLGMPF